MGVLSKLSRLLGKSSDPEVPAPEYIHRQARNTGDDSRRGLEMHLDSRTLLGPDSRRVEKMMKKGGKVSAGYRKVADGCAKRGKTRGKMV